MAAVDTSPRFGAELLDSFKPVNAWVTSGVEWLDDIQQFYRERSVIEKEYSTKLAALARKYFDRKAKKSSTLSVGESPTVTPGSLESASMTTWTVQLTTLESRAAEHDRFASDLVSNLAEPLKNLNARCEDLRKQHAEYAGKLERERDGSFGELKRTKGRYDNACQEVENKRKKTDSSFDMNKQKAQAAYQQQLPDMQNAKNSYLVSINVANKQKERYYHGYVPELLDSLQDLSESRVTKLNAIWSHAARIESSTLSRSNEYMKHLESEIVRNEPRLDSMMFVRHNMSQWQEPRDFIFEPSPVWLDDEAMIKNETAKVYLRNMLAKSKDQLGSLRREVDQKRKDHEAVKRTRQNVRDGKDNKDEVEVARALFAVQEELHERERLKTTAEVEVATIITAVGDVSVGARNHNFRSQTFKIPTNCDLCGERLWGLSAKGFDCKDCGFICHSKCELKVPADCPGEQSKEERRRLKVERQEAARVAQPVEEALPERQASAPSINRSDTINSMNTLSSGYAANAGRSISAASPDVSGAEDKPATKPSVKGRNRVVAPPPTQYVKTPTNGLSGEEKRGKMLYSFQQNGAGEITVSESTEVTIIEPDDGSGWMKVRCNGDEGLVPASYVEILPTTQSSSDLDRHSTYSASSVSLAGSIAERSKKKGPVVAPKRGAKKLKHVEALYDYEARSEAEHSMEVGERMVLVNKEAGEGWSDVEKNGMVKSVPANYIQDV
ncbi:MAG: hypothetical protein M1828_003529 [Chrysothrix sp. TS-e1954]|nr:MAG: hypothetical protein M1828_003529 [Chrysothrix sp. TS-e1954]